MKNTILMMLSLLLILIMSNGIVFAQNQEKPNIILIFADDLGYGDLGAYGQKKIETPNIDALAESGMKFTQHYAGSTVCAPSRYTLMTGKHTGNAYIRSNDEAADRDLAYDYKAMLENPDLEGQRPIPPSTITIADLFKNEGYHTGAFGKWGLGGPTIGGHPNDHGFDLFFGYLCQRQAHTYYPTHLWRNDQRVLLNNELVNPKQSLPDGLDPYDPESYTPFHDQPDYSAEIMHKEAIRFIEDHHERPFFLYLPTPIPHVPVQAPKRWIDYYRDKFGDEEPFLGGRYVPARHPNANYAAMISYLDEQVGDIIAKLKELGIYDNTLIMFTNDNGNVDGHGVNPEYFNSAGPFIATRGRVKGYLHEGGIRVPMIVSWNNHIAPGSTSDHISASWDIMPTLGEIAGFDPPDDIDGISFLPTLLGNEQEQDQHEYLYWEFPSYGGQQAVRLGKWKGIRKDIVRDGNLDIELYNLDEDIQELNNVADRHPDIVNEIRIIMETARTVPEVDRFKMQALGDYDN